ncbi:transcription factor NAI1-like [Phragmites australis]|uniref:transcription factor NAI1-like n=1 Tax=Phragmites australis TaxID=29695 RepID=UPI002D76FAFF|nr:transcription factor NAI1-like [Phragmites australis]
MAKTNDTCVNSLLKLGLVAYAVLHSVYPTEMDFSANQWLAELEIDDVGELEFVDPLSMQQLAESLANELWSHPHPEQQEQQSPTGISFVGDMKKGDFRTAVVSAGGSNVGVFSFANDSLNLSAQQQRQEKRGGRKATSSVQEHVIAERKRREKMQQQLATLASIIPDITKTDKVSLLGSTIEYVHHLRDRLKALQDQSTGSSTAECIGGSQRDDKEAAVSPKMEADMQGTTVLLRVVCREKKGLLVMLLTELEKHGLSIVNANVVPFAESSLNITITAQIEDGSSTTVELVKSLNVASLEYDAQIFFMTLTLSGLDHQVIDVVFYGLVDEVIKDDRHGALFAARRPPTGKEPGQH